MKKKQSRFKGPVVTPTGMRIAREVAIALRTVEQLPVASWWPVILNLLPDDCLEEVLRARDEPAERIWPVLGPSLFAIVQAYTEDLPVTDDTRDKLLWAGLNGLVVGAILELERRRKRLCANAPQIENPFTLEDIDLDNICPESGKITITDLFNAHEFGRGSDSAPAAGQAAEAPADAGRAVVAQTGAEGDTEIVDTVIEVEEMAPASGD
jgi:hypothetical protein